MITTQLLLVDEIVAAGKQQKKLPGPEEAPDDMA
jgi:hypothetical protein